MEHVASVLDCSRARVGHIENGRNNIRKPELTVLLDVYGATPEERSALEELREQASRRGWWSTYRLPAWLQTYVGLEADAITVRSFEGELIPGLLQTADYARRIHVVAEHSTNPADVDLHVEARLRRQERLEADTPPDFAAVVSEAAFRRALGDPEAVGREQIDRVADLVERRVARVHVLPYSAGLHPSMSGSFTVLGFGNAAKPVGYQEYAVGGHLVDDTAVVERLRALWEDLRGRALSVDDSVAWLRGLSTSAD